MFRGIDLPVLGRRKPVHHGYTSSDTTVMFRRFRRVVPKVHTEFLSLYDYHC